MVRRRLGKTGASVSPIALGAFKIGRNEQIKYARDYALPDDAETRRLLNGALDLGINLIDTAPAYGVSEERIGQFLAHRRGEYLLSTKAGETFENGQSTYDFSRQAITASVHRSLRRLRTDVLDFVFIHSDGRDLWILQETDAPAALRDLRQAGLIRFIGLSGKTPEGARAALPWADALMVEYHPGDFSHEALIADAAGRGVGILVKKPLASGSLDPASAIPFILANRAVSTLVIGTLSLEHLRQNLQLCSA